MMESDAGWKKFFKKYNVQILCLGVYVLLGIGTVYDIDPAVTNKFWTCVAGAAGFLSGMLIVRLLGWKKYHLPWKFVLLFCAFNWYMMSVVSPARANPIAFRLAAVAAVFGLLGQWRMMRARGRK